MTIINNRGQICNYVCFVNREEKTVGVVKFDFIDDVLKFREHPQNYLNCFISGGHGSHQFLTGHSDDDVEIELIFEPDWKIYEDQGYSCYICPDVRNAFDVAMEPPSYSQY